MQKMKKSIALVLACIIAVVLLILTAAFIFNVVMEKNFSEREHFSIEAANIAEAGINHGINELRNKILIDLNNAVSGYRNGTAFIPYADTDIANKDSLDFLCDFIAFSHITGSNDVVKQTFSSATLPQGSGITRLGAYNGTIYIRKQRDTSGNVMQGYILNPNSPNTFVFPYEFTIEAVGTVSGLSQGAKIVQGKFTVTVQRLNFARFALFTNHHSADGSTTVWFTEKTSFYGPVHTNEQFSFANNPSGYFSDEVTQHNQNARFYNNGRSVLLNAESNPPYDVPTFAAGFQRGVDSIDLPTSTTQSDLKRQALGTMSEPTVNGIYVPNDGTKVTGGIYIRGNAAITTGVDNNNNATYTVTQGSTTKAVTVDYNSNQTTVKQGASAQTYAGLPDGIGNEGIIIYDTGSVTSLSGTIQQSSQVTISSQNDTIITNHIRYQQYDTTPNLNAQNYTNLLGIISWGGNVRIGTGAPNNLELHGVVMAPGGIFTVDNYQSRPPSGNVTLLGGVITNYYGAFGTFSGTTQRSGYGRNFLYDQRMLGAMSPPYFPTSQAFTAVAPLLSRAFKEMDVIWQKQ